MKILKEDVLIYSNYLQLGKYTNRHIQAIKLFENNSNPSNPPISKRPPQQGPLGPDWPDFLTQMGILPEDEVKKMIRNVETSIPIAKEFIRRLYPYFYRLLNSFKVIIVNPYDPIVTTMAVDAYKNIYVNPAFSNKLSQWQFTSIFAHEVNHIANDSFGRQRGRDQLLWNLATDAVMNTNLRLDGLDIPAGTICGADQEMGKHEYKDEKGNVICTIYTILTDKLNNRRFATCEEVYDQHEKAKEKIKEQFGEGKPKEGEGECKDGKCENPGKGKGKGQGKGQGQGQGEGKGQGQGNKPGNVKPGQGQGKGQSQGQGNGGMATDAEVENFFRKQAEKAKKAGGDTHLTKEEAQERNPEIEGYSKEELDALERQRQNDLKDGLNKSGPNKGSTGRGVDTGGVRADVEASIPKYVDWKSILKKYLTGRKNTYTSWMVPSRRGMAAGYQSPSKLPTPNNLTAVIALDTSGSMGDKEIAEMFGFVKQILGMKECVYNIHIVLWHTNMYYYSPKITSLSSFEEISRKIVTQDGGTLISSVKIGLDKLNVRPNLIIYMTDGYVEDHNRRILNNCKKLFLIVNSHIVSEQAAKAVEQDFNSHGNTETVVARTLLK